MALTSGLTYPPPSVPSAFSIEGADEFSSAGLPGSYQFSWDSTPWLDAPLSLQGAVTNPMQTSGGEGFDPLLAMINYQPQYSSLDISKYRYDPYGGYMQYQDKAGNLGYLMGQGRPLSPELDLRTNYENAGLPVFRDPSKANQEWWQMGYDPYGTAASQKSPYKLAEPTGQGWFSQNMDWLVPLAIGGLGGGLAASGVGMGGAAPAAATGAAATGAAGGGMAWAPSMGAVEFGSMPWAAGLGEAGTLAGQGLTMAEMGSLGIPGPIAAGGAAQNYLSNYFGNPFSARTAGNANMGWLDTLINVGGNLASGYLAADASKDASKAQQEAADQASQTAWAMYQQNRSDLAPWRAAGVNALAEMTGGMPNWQTDPGYQFRLAEGQKALERSAAARGLLQSGTTLKDATRYGQDMASSEFGNAWNRQAGLAGVGQTATNTGVLAGQNTANQVAQNQLGAGNARASGYVGTANAWGNALGNTLNNYNQQEWMRRIMGGGY